MKKQFVLAALAAAIAPGLALGQEKKTFARCTGDHHGSYLALVSSSTGGAVTGVTIDVTNDSGAPAKVYQVKKVTKNGQALEAKGYSWAIRQAIKADGAGDFYGFIKIDATGPGGSQLFVNLNKPVGELRQALAIDGYIEQLDCPVSQIKD